MKTHFLISSEEIGTVLLRRRKIAKALCRWLHENGYPFKGVFFVKL
jgi:hypothetical protein